VVLTVEAQRPDAPDRDTETYGFQWKTIGSLLAAFWVSTILTYLAQEGSSGSDRLWEAVKAAGIVFFGAMFGMRILRGFVGRKWLSSTLTFLVVWVIAFFVWFFVRTQ
jgi:hypothetical protein